MVINAPDSPLYLGVEVRPSLTGNRRQFDWVISIHSAPDRTNYFYISIPANLILIRSRGCRISVDVTPPDIPAIMCSYLTCENIPKLPLALALTTAPPLPFLIAVMDDGCLDWSCSYPRTARIDIWMSRF